jgi:phosphoglycerol transferase MdoB-like AlkP superfamily enzyme
MGDAAFCKEWFNVQVYLKAAAYGPSLIVVLINALIGLPVLYWAAENEKLKSSDSETKVRMVLVLTAWFINCAVVLIFYV